MFVKYTVRCELQIVETTGGDGIKSEKVNEKNTFMWMKKRSFSKEEYNLEINFKSPDILTFFFARFDVFVKCAEKTLTNKHY